MEREQPFIPMEIAEEILLNLRVKSLLRFSTVSKSWNSLINSDQRFIRKYSRRAAVHGRERVLVSQSTTTSLTLPLYSLLSTQAAANTAPLIIPFKMKISEINVLASCGELWCIEYNDSLLSWNPSLFLWNPSMGTFKKLPNPLNLGLDLELFKMSEFGIGYDFEFGIGYDSVEDDYKILKMRKGTFPELYSLRSDSWKTIQPFSTHANSCISYASGVFYWMDSEHDDGYQDIIVSFELSSEKYVEVAPPPYVRPVNFDNGDMITLSILKGKLGLHVYYSRRKKYVLWVRKDCKWRKMYGIDWSLDKGREIDITNLIVLYHDNSKILIDAMVGESKRVFVCKVWKSRQQTVYHCNYDEDDDLSRELYVESLVSPATYCRRHGVVDGGNRPRNRICASLVWIWSFVLYCVSVWCSVIEIILELIEELVRAFT